MTKQNLEDSWTAVRPKIREGSESKLTARDGSNIGILGSLTIVVTWLVHDVLGLPLTPEVAVALCTSIVYVGARKFRY